MTNDRMSSLALLAGTAGVIITLALHPTGRGLFAAETFQAEARKLIAVHSLALISLPVWFMGACGLSRRLASASDARTASNDPSGFVGLVLYGFAVAAMSTAVVFDGLVSPGLAHQIINATGTVGQGWRIAFNYNGMVDQAFVRVFIVGSSLAVAVWSVSMVRNQRLARPLGIYGCILGAASVIALISGQLDHYAHIFGMVLMGQALWFAIAGGLLWRVENT